LPRATTLKIAFAAFTVAQFVSIFGDRLHQFSVVGMIGRVAPGSTVDLFLFALFSHLPILLFAPLLGTVVDRANRALVMVLADVFRGTLVALIPLLYHRMGSMYAFYVPVFFLSLANLLFGPAKSAAIPEYFGGLRLIRINAFLWGLGIVGSIGGFAVGGWLFDYRRWELSFYADAGSYLVSVVFLLPLFAVGARSLRRSVAPDTPDSPPHPSPERAPLASSFRDALALIRRDRRIAFGLVAQTALLGAFGVLYVAGIARVQEVLPADKTIYLSAVATSGTVGLLAGSAVAALSHSRARAGRIVSICAFILGAAMVGVSQARGLGPLMAWTFFMGLAFSPIMIVTETLLQTETPGAFRGRVFAAREVGVKMSFLGLSFLATISTAVVDKGMVILVTGVLLAVVALWVERRDFLGI
jgi:MFS family permease